MNKAEFMAATLIFMHACKCSMAPSTKIVFDDGDVEILKGVRDTIDSLLMRNAAHSFSIDLDNILKELES